MQKYATDACLAKNAKTERRTKVRNDLIAADKSLYEEPSIQVSLLAAQDVVTTSAPKKDWSAEWDII